ncbi:MAG: MBL fold metallo-hydrolase [Pseudanabaenaceae cyanobacterium bins.68]|nr:MBL fold metallo-hydrolase [Pseudanabaenaceae cyanobacterium bins.68]
MYLTWLDSNSWWLEIADQHILIDPWLVGALTFGDTPWLFKAERPKPCPIPPQIDLILLSQGLADHAHLPTLKFLQRDIPVIGSAGAAQVARDLGYHQVTALQPGVSHSFRGIQITATQGSLTGPNRRENGYVIQSADGSLYYEPHGSHDPSLADHPPVDVVITPIMDLAIPLLGKIIQGQAAALQAATWLAPQVMIPTASAGNLNYSGLLLKLLRTEGDAAQLRSDLAHRQMATQLVELAPGDRFEVKPRIAQVA